VHEVADVDGSRLDVLVPRDVPLGGPRSMSVRRTLPQRHRSLIGAWCFLDHYGPDEVESSGGMHVPPHPHAGLQTATWLFAGEVEHRDSGGGHATIGPGQLSLMTAGHGIAHSEVSTPSTTELHGVQLWIALPDAARETERRFEHYAPRTVGMEGAAVTVFLGELVGDTSPIATHTPLLGAEIVLGPHVALDLGVESSFEHGVLVDTGDVSVDASTVEPHHLAYVAPGSQRLALVNHGDSTARLLLIGGTPFTEPIAMWWNFVGRTHDDIETMRRQWQEHSDRFGEVAGFEGDVVRLEAPELPHVRIRPRTNPPAG
jgi:redox-sensitive bicupin YhaK (pirin superfamily)